MKLKRILLLILAFSIFGVVTVLASDTLNLKGKHIKVSVNNKELSAPGLLIEERTYLPVREMSETLQAIVKWDELKQTVNIYKPNIHISLFVAQKNGGFAHFGQVQKGNNFKFYIFSQIDSLSTPLHSYRVTMVDPNGTTVYVHQENIQDKAGDFWYGTPEIEHEFKHEGDYVVKGYMKSEYNGEYFLVSEKTIPSIARR